MAQNVTIAGASYSDVPSIQVPKTGSGTATFYDISDTTASAADVAAGKYFYTAAGVKTEGTGSGGGDISHYLPVGYQEVKYIIGSETGAVIDTGIQPDETTYADFKFVPLATTGDVLLGTKGANDNADWRFFNYSNGPYWDYYNKRLTGSSGSLPLNEIAEFQVRNGVCQNLITGGQLTGDTLSSFSVPYNIFINGESASMTAQATWYYVTIYKNEQKVREYIPCYRESDDAVGFYDLINDTFSTSVGNGDFIAGPNISSGQSDLTNIKIYIEQDQDGYLLLTDTATIPTAVGVSF